MTPEATMPIRWHFVEGYEGDSSHWSWRTVNVDGTLESHSPPFKTYGIAVSDAIKNGFQPRQQHWVVSTRHTITHFRPGKPPLTVPVSDTASSILAKTKQKQAGSDMPLADEPQEKRPTRHEPC